MLLRVLLALGRSDLGARLLGLLEGQSAIPSLLPAGADLVAHLRTRPNDLVVLDPPRLPPGHAARARTITAVRDLPEPPEIAVVARGGDAELLGPLAASGAIALIDAGLSDEALTDALRALLRRRREDLRRSLLSERAEDRASLADFVSHSATMTAFLDVVRRVVPANVSVLILGETGVGKERLARAIHNEGPRARSPFLAVNCAALPDALLESELFGHEEGAFTGAIRPHRGYFELAHRGTIFLDEVGEMSPHLQVKLLRVLQERTIQPVGSEAPVGVDVRVMAATNRDLAAELRSGRFRADLYYRLAVVTLTVPPLRERREDIAALAESYIDHFRARLSHKVDGVHPSALAAMLDYRWPGNVRELINVVERALLLSNGSEIALADLPVQMRAPAPDLSSSAAPASAPDETPAESLPWRAARERALRAFEKEYFSTLLAHTGGRVGEAARRAQIDPRALYDKLKRLGLRKEDFRPEGRPKSGLTRV